jgi:hypothetical protein
MCGRTVVLLFRLDFAFFLYLLPLVYAGMGFLRKPVAILAALASSNWPQHCVSE